MDVNHPTEEIFTIKELADYLKVNERTLYKLATDGSLPAFKVGGSWRFQRASIQKWIEQQTAQQH
ncbi:helix-turn-helix domain-containing protein [Endozoicomonas gorgoniicola]|uniref:Helix-turn-helix domain-containing protein n=1 Tax=Endozoicomonas gorgoniicola TaxID=1234144 RepID=A0ABT3N341_9GAMM|nr:helix-turn-helix domain-containing protein [Endozoicomonas gorgoniicola]MCW7556029.1 helix-turn-helix domain-containing protein [Endozoicomonas gorgoniicola]